MSQFHQWVQSPLQQMRMCNDLSLSLRCEMHNVFFGFNSLEFGGIFLFFTLLNISTKIEANKCLKEDCGMSRSQNVSVKGVEFGAFGIWVDLFAKGDPRGTICRLL